jgi:hypothetical protein
MHRPRVALLVLAALVSALCGWLASSLVATPRITPLNTVVLSGYGVGSIRFGLPEREAVSALESLLGTPNTRHSSFGNCGINSDQWTNFAASFQRGDFVGYAATVDNFNGLTDPFNGETVKGLRIGDSVERAMRLYSSDFTESPAHNGTFTIGPTAGEEGGFAAVGELGGNLSGYAFGLPATHLTARIGTIEAGHVGCPDFSPF